MCATCEFSEILLRHLNYMAVEWFMWDSKLVDLFVKLLFHNFVLFDLKCIQSLGSGNQAIPCFLLLAEIFRELQNCNSVPVDESLKIQKPNQHWLIDWPINS